MYNISMLNKYFFLILLSIVPLHYSAAQDKSPSQIKSEMEQIGEESFESIRFDRLKRMRKEIVQIESKIYLNKKEIKKQEDMVLKLKLESENEKLQKVYNAKRILFIETITGLPIFQSSEVAAKDESFSENLSDILRPALSGIKGLSERPRQIQMLEENIKVYTAELNTVKLALEKIEKYQKDKEYKDFYRTLKKSKKKLKTVKNDFEIKLEDAQFNLLKLEKNQGSFVGVFSKAIFDFLKTKGKNLFLSISAFILIVWFLGRVKNRVISFFVDKFLKIYGPHDQGLWFIRPIKVIYSLTGFLLALFVGILILYIMNDWVLVTFILFTLGALVWSSKEYFPTFFEQSKIVLNLGAIRENEVVIFEEIPWKIKTLGYYCRLENPLLTGGSLRIGSRELVNSHSRPIQVNEPWFPTKTNDWVVLDEEVYGKVTFQSPEQVLVKLIGGATKYLKVDEFLKMNPLNLSNGFGIKQIIGVDYQHQSILLDEVVPNFKEAVTKSLKEFLKDEYKSVYEFQIDFLKSGSSSLDIRFFLICSGALASKKLLLERTIQNAFVKVCNDNHYVIPFTQMTVHMAKTGE